MDFARESQGLGCYGDRAIVEFGERKHMKKLAFVLAGAAALSLAACNKNQDQVQNAELNQPAADELNQQASDAANDAAHRHASRLPRIRVVAIYELQRERVSGSHLQAGDRHVARRDAQRRLFGGSGDRKSVV